MFLFTPGRNLHHPVHIKLYCLIPSWECEETWRQCGRGDGNVTQTRKEECSWRDGEQISAVRLCSQVDSRHSLVVIRS